MNTSVGAVRYGVSGPIARITMNRPPVNARSKRGNLRKRSIF